jgi:hypothetical protein
MGQRSGSNNAIGWAKAPSPTLYCSGAVKAGRLETSSRLSSADTASHSAVPCSAPAPEAQSQHAANLDLAASKESGRSVLPRTRLMSHTTVRPSARSISARCGSNALGSGLPSSMIARRRARARVAELANAVCSKVLEADFAATEADGGHILQAKPGLARGHPFRHRPADQPRGQRRDPEAAGNDPLGSNTLFPHQSLHCVDTAMRRPAGRKQLLTDLKDAPGPAERVKRSRVGAAVKQR